MIEHNAEDEEAIQFLTDTFILSAERRGTQPKQRMHAIEACFRMLGYLTGDLPTTGKIHVRNELKACANNLDDLFKLPVAES